MPGQRFCKSLSDATPIAFNRVFRLSSASRPKDEASDRMHTLQGTKVGWLGGWQSCLFTLTLSRLRCDHALPSCGQCVSRGDITACRYVRRKNEARGAVSGPAAPPDATSASKIDNLERLLLNFVKGQQQNAPQDDAHFEQGADDVSSPLEVYGAELQDAPSMTRNVPATSEASPTISIAADHRQASSVDQAHWALLMNEVSLIPISFLLMCKVTDTSQIGDLRTALVGKQQQLGQANKEVVDSYSPAHMHSTSSLLFGCSRTITRSEVLAQLPARYSCDILVTRFFAHLYPAVRQYYPAVPSLSSATVSDLSRYPP
jgi:hypothetical protein